MKTFLTVMPHLLTSYPAAASTSSLLGTRFAFYAMSSYNAG